MIGASICTDHASGGSGREGRTVFIDMRRLASDLTPNVGMGPFTIQQNVLARSHRSDVLAPGWAKGQAMSPNRVS